MERKIIQIMIFVLSFNEIIATDTTVIKLPEKTNLPTEPVSESSKERQSEPVSDPIKQPQKETSSEPVETLPEKTKKSPTPIPLTTSTQKSSIPEENKESIDYHNSTSNTEKTPFFKNLSTAELLQLIQDKILELYPVEDKETTKVYFETIEEDNMTESKREPSIIYEEEENSRSFENDLYYYQIEKLKDEINQLSLKIMNEIKKENLTKEKVELVKELWFFMVASLCQLIR